MEKRALIAVVLSLVILIGYSYLEIKYFKPTSKESSKGVDQTTEALKERKSGKEETGTKTESGTINIPTVTADNVSKGEINEEEILVENEVYKAVFTNRGGKIKKFYMKNYLDRKGHALNLIPEEAQNFSLPLTLVFGQEELSKRLDGALYDVSLADKKLLINDVHPIAKVEFIYDDKQHYRVKKTLTFHSGKYAIDVDIDVKNLGNETVFVPYEVLWGPGIFSDLSESDAKNMEVSTLLNGKKTDLKADKVEKANIYKGKIEWTAIHDKFFTAIMMPKEVDNTVIVTKNSRGELLFGLEFNGREEAKSESFTLYIGPKESSRLKSLGMGLDKLIDYGMFSIIVEPLEKLLHWFYDYTGNYGIAIILLTVLVKIIFFPLTHKSFKSMQGMQTIQPKIKVIQEKFKNDKVRLNQEMMRIYRENKINPMGGCLPMVLQIPVFIALYQLLLNSIDLRMAPFFWWITDLSNKDPYYISPIIMGASMFIQQKMTPTAGDPKMAKMMLFMPVIFTVMFLQFPVGLVIYWLINNILTIGQQLIISKIGAAEHLKKKSEIIQESK